MTIAEMERRKVYATLPRNCPVCDTGWEFSQLVWLNGKTTLDATCSKCKVKVAVVITHSEEPESVEKEAPVSPENPGRGIY